MPASALIRIAHFTDLHVTHRIPLSPASLFSKRVFNAINSWMEGPKRVFSPVTQQRMVDAIKALTPDAVVCTGDVTGTGLRSEYETAREIIAPLMNSVPSLIVPGNHVST